MTEPIRSETSDQNVYVVAEDLEQFVPVRLAIESLKKEPVKTKAYSCLIQSSLIWFLQPKKIFFVTAFFSCNYRLSLA